MKTISISLLAAAALAMAAPCLAQVQDNRGSQFGLQPHDQEGPVVSPAPQTEDADRQIYQPLGTGDQDKDSAPIAPSTTDTHDVSPPR
jgi:hypothetical protein